MHQIISFDIQTDGGDGKKQLTNGMSRVHQILTEEEIAQGKTTRWMELEIHGLFVNTSEMFSR